LVYGKKLTNSGPLRESADKHSIYPPEAGRLAQQLRVWQITAGHVVPPEPATFPS